MSIRETAFDSASGSLLDQIIWRMRVGKVMRRLGSPVSTVVDLGCGRSAPLLRQLLKAGAAHHAIGVDLAPDFDVNAPGLKLVQADLNTPLPLRSSSADVVLSLAVIEHLTAAVLHLQEIRRVLKPHGRLLLTTPSPRGKPVLEFLAFRLGVIDRLEIEDHKNYFDGRSLTAMLLEAGFASEQLQVSTFQLGMNNIVTASR